MIKQIISHIKEKKELRQINDKFIEFLAKESFDSFSGEIDKIKKTSKYKKKFKEIRALLRKIFWVSDEFKFNFTKKLSKEEIFDILSRHPSTKERLPYYNTIYSHIMTHNPQPTTILDLGCGLNPFSYIFLDAEYSCYDVFDYPFFNTFFKLNKIKAKYSYFNLLDLDSYSILPKADICFLFKVIDSLELIQRNISKKIIKKIPAKHIVVSFSKLTASSKQMKNKTRNWFRKMLEKEKYSFTTFEIPNEIFYIINN